MRRCDRDGSAKANRRPRTLRRRLRSSVVHDPNGSRSTFRSFYQSGGRDYDQYRRWLQVQSESNPPSLTSPNALNSVEVKSEPVETDSDPLPEFPSSPSPHSPRSRSSSKTDYTHASHIPMRHSSSSLFPPHCPSSSASSKLPFPPSTTSFEDQIRTLHDHYHASALLPPVAPFLSSPLFHWSVDDVARFIETNFFEKTIAEKFAEQRIDGPTLALLTEDHLVRVFKMKLGPALRLLAFIAHFHGKMPLNENPLSKHVRIKLLSKSS